MEPLAFVALAGGAVMAFMTVLWLVSLAVRDSSIVDVFWGVAFIIVVWLGVAFGPGDAARRWLLAVLVTIWAARLSIRIGRRNFGHPEDFRYAAWRARAGAAWWWRSLFKVFWLQGAVAVIVAAPLLAGVTGRSPVHLTVFDLLGAGVWLVGLAFEAIGDRQLDRFKADPANKGKIMDRGLWAYTRHPNYFGDALLWWGYGLIALLTPWGFPALIGPALMTFLLVRVSGVAMLERSMASRPGWADYAARTNAFVPWFPKAA